MADSLPVWRSMLYVPVIVPRFVAGAAGRGADAIILDLEDSVPPAQKESARSLIAPAAATVASQGADVVVRVNRPWRMLVRDIEAAVGPGVAALALPKVESAEYVQAAAETVAEIEAERGLPPGHTKLLVMIETAGALFRIEAIARSHPRVVALTIGTEDLALSLGMAPEAEALLVPSQLAIIAARAAGVLPIGFLGTVAEFADLDAFRAIIRRSRRLGFAGAACVHPSQVAILNEEYAPSAAEVDQATRLVAAYDAALAARRGAVAFEGRMIDAPVVERARAVLAQNAAIRARTSATGRAAGRA